jgi:RHS repeat-associated protein
LESSLGLYFYNARWYDPAVGGFIQADIIVPEGVQGPDRYAYVGNNPLKNTDPSGHQICTDDGYCGDLGDTAYQMHIYRDAIQNVYQWNLVGIWSLDELKSIYKTGYDIQRYTNTITGRNGLDWMYKYLGGKNISHRCKYARDRSP